MPSRVQACGCESPGLCPRHKRHKGPGALELCRTSPSYRALWDEQAGYQAPNEEPCGYLGEQTGEAECTGCAKGKRLKVFACDFYGSATLGRVAEGVPGCCLLCNDYVPRSKYRGKLPSMAVRPEMSVGDLVQILRGSPRNFPAGWEHWPVTHQAHLRLLEEFAEIDRPYPDSYRGKGIVIGAGGAKFFQCAWACATVLRGIGCTLPIEFWYLGRYELDPTMERAAELVGIRCVDASKVAKSLPVSPRILNGWELKPFSVLHSAFEEVLYLDADNVPVLDPSYLFEAQEYGETGAIFWPDLSPNDRKEWLPSVVWKNLGMEHVPEPDFESGQFLVNKARCWKVLQVTQHLNEHSDWYYKFVFGDKSTYHLAWRKLRQDYSMPRKEAGWRWPAIQQYGFHDELVFQHACRGKESICSGDSLGSIHNHPLIYRAARDLRALWSGSIWNYYDQTPEEKLLGEQIAEGRYEYDRVGIGTRKLALARAGQITEGGAKCEKRWSLRILDGVPTLAIVGEAHKESEVAIILLTQRSDKVWDGYWQTYEKNRTELRRIP